MIFVTNVIALNIGIKKIKSTATPLSSNPLYFTNKHITTLYNTLPKIYIITPTQKSASTPTAIHNKVAKHKFTMRFRLNIMTTEIM